LRDRFRRHTGHNTRYNWETVMQNLNTLFAVTALASGALAAGSVSTVARAESITAPPSITVFYGDLDINNVRGAARLYQRISFAAETVCRDLGRGRQLTLLSRYKSCVRSAINDAVAYVNRSALTEYAASRGVGPAGAPIKMKVAQAQVAHAN
jgi:UrcA family protein